MLHRHDPVPESDMYHVSPNETVCETLRQAYWMTEDDDLRLLLRIATAKAKAMSKRLGEYKRRGAVDLWQTSGRFFEKTGKIILAPPIDVLFIAYDDNANTGFRLWQCAKELGLHSIMVKGVSHPFGYPVQAPIHPSLANRPISTKPLTIMAPGLEHLINSAAVVHLIASTYPLCHVNWKDKNVVVNHGGSLYRQSPEEHNEVFNQIVSSTVIQCPDLLGLGAKNEHLIYYPVDTNLLFPEYERKGSRLVVGHFPSNPSVKGTKEILSVLSGLGVDVRTGGRVPWVDNLKRMSECDVIVETMNVTQDGKPYGEWGNTALEGSALGCVVVTNHVHQKAYKENYGEHALWIANSRDELISSIERLKSLSDEELLSHKIAARDWAVEKHGIVPTANRLWDLVYRDLLEGADK